MVANLKIDIQCDWLLALSYPAPPNTLTLSEHLFSCLHDKRYYIDRCNTSYLSASTRMPETTISIRPTSRVQEVVEGHTT